MRWATVPKNNNYEISDEGEVRNKNTGRILSGSVNNGGYRTVHINRNESPDFVHRLVAETFIQNPEPDIRKDVNHKDGDKMNNNVSNLEWVTRSKNVKHAYEHGLNRPSGGGHNKRSILVEETGEIYQSQEECARAIGGSIGGVSMSVNGNRKTDTYKGYHLRLV